MRWRILVRVLASVLLVLPMAGVIFVSMQPRAVPEVQDANVLPMLTEDARRSLLTYQRECRSDADCEPPLGCFMAGHSGLAYCTDSNCAQDTDCPEGFACVRLKSTLGKNPVRVCSLLGHRKEGEVCWVPAHSLEDACDRGLSCQWRCGRPCRVDDPSSCPAGFFCLDGREGLPSCMPTCEGRSCPEGQECIPRGIEEDGVSVCGRVEGPDCRKDPCPEGLYCDVFEVPQRPWEMRTQCIQWCKQDSDCPEGISCLVYECRKPCDPQSPSSCGPGLTCGHHHPLGALVLHSGLSGSPSATRTTRV